jgi:hypothetical protein
MISCVDHKSDRVHVYVMCCRGLFPKDGRGKRGVTFVNFPVIFLKSASGKIQKLLN